MADGRTLIVVPTLGQRAKWLGEAIRSVRGQTPSPDIVVVTSADAPEGVRDLAARYHANLEIQHGRGLSQALNQTLMDDRYEYVGWLGDDDVLMPGGLNAVQSRLRESPEAVMAYGQCLVVDASGQLMFRIRPGRLAPWLMRFGANYLPQPGSLMRSAAFARVGGLDESLRYAMDLDLFLRLRLVGDLAYVSQPVARFRVHPGSLTVSKTPGVEAKQVRDRYLSPRAEKWNDRMKPGITLAGKLWGKLQSYDRTDGVGWDE